jgi:tetratricopeptide (TPR) repeat protein
MAPAGLLRVAAAWGCLVPPLALAPQDPAQAYRGKYAAQPAFRERLAATQAAWRRAVAGIERKLAIAPRDPAKISVEIADALAPEADPIVRFRGEPFEVVVEGENVVVRVRAEFVMRGSLDLEDALVSGGVRAILTERLSERAVSMLAPWMVEGLAGWAADAGEVMWLDTLRANRAKVDPAAIFLGVGVADHTPERRIEDVLAVDFIAARKGAKAPARLAAFLLQREDAFDALRALSGLEWGAFRAGAQEHGLRKTRSWTPKEWDAYVALARQDQESAAAGEEKLRELERACEAFASRNKSSSLLPDVLLWRGRALARLGRGEEALAALRRAIELDPGAPSCVDDASVEVGAVLLAREEAEGALDAFERVLRDHPDSPLLDRALAGKAHALARLGRKEEAIRSIDLFERSFPESAAITDVRELRRALLGD